MGDCIEISSEKLSGIVEKISWYYTQLRTYDKQPVFFPNLMTNWPAAAGPKLQHTLLL